MSVESLETIEAGRRTRVCSPAFKLATRAPVGPGQHSLRCFCQEACQREGGRGVGDLPS